MRLYIAGGCGEHGRNCFYMQGETICFLVDCGVMAGESGGGYPRLSQEQIHSLDCVFLTHSHADHTGALPWLLQNGFCGPVIATQDTMIQLSPILPEAVPLESICPGGSGCFRNLKVEWGRSGHCAGSVWYRFTENEKTILFSGDYTEDTLVYPCDALRGKTADLAVLDCAYGKDETPFAISCDALVSQVAVLLKKYKLLLFPVPKYGRGLELRKLFADADLKTEFYGDALFLKNLNRVSEDPFWYTAQGAKWCTAAPYSGQKAGIVFISDPQLRTPEAKGLADAALALGGHGVMTGTVENGTLSERLIQQGQMTIARYPVHLNWAQYSALAARNQFKQIIPYHTGVFSAPSTIAF
ncbi:MAG: MBL fold metallo-hydrolase [Oscillospiraceae bacterium]|nr:MBL fold metallo-hydrolase [Oscillospiraceae bacterium]